MSHRLPTGGRLIDRDRTVSFSWNGKPLKGFSGDTLASALLANDQVFVGRSFKYHRPRGIVASGVEEPNALVSLGEGSGFEPNARATTTPLTPGLMARSQNHWPSLRFDIGAINARLAPLFPAGFYYKTFIHPRAAWKHVFEPVIRRSAGLGDAPTRADSDSYEHFHVHVDILVIGGGIAGIAAAGAAAASGAKTLLIEQSGHWGGRAPVDAGPIDGMAADSWTARAVAELGALPNVSLRLNTTGAAVHDHGYVLANERLMQTRGPRERLWRIRAGRIITATGAIERPVAFAKNDVPGVMLAGAARDFVELWGTAPGNETVIVTNNDSAYRTALVLNAAGLSVPAILDVRKSVTGSLPQAARDRGIHIMSNHGIASISGTTRVTAVAACRQDGAGAAVTSIPCDAVAMSGGWSPAVHLWSHCGGKLTWDADQAFFTPDPARPPTGRDGLGFVLAAGSAAGAMDTQGVLDDAVAVGRRAAEQTGHTPADAQPHAATAEEEHPLEPVWIMPRLAPHRLRSRSFLDFQNDVKVSDIQLAAREGFRSVEHTKRYTTLGMATDQGKLSNINGLAVLSEALQAGIPDVGTTTFRPPYTPVTLGTVAGAARGPLFRPLRKSPIDGWSAAHGAHWEPVGDWRRAYCYLQPGETVEAAVKREVTTTRTSVGALDASTLGKILVRGPDAGKFLDLLYTNMMSTLPPGRCRYGLMCNENGFLFDDGVVARIGAETFLCHTTTGGADRVHAWMEEWLQTEWWDLKVFTANVTEQFAQITVVGPRARSVLQALGGIALDRESLPFMHWTAGAIAGIPARVYRISFSGELSYEVAVPAGRGQEFWNAVMDAGAEHGITPYGTEALHVMRAEKGFIMIGDETDGTVTPLDLNLGWAVSKKKADFIGKRAMERPDLIRPGRKQLVGLRTEDPTEVLPGGAHAIEGDPVADGPTRTVGHVTSSYFSDTLGHSIALALIENGLQRTGETLRFSVSADRTIAATITDPVFLDPEGSRQNV